MKNILTITAIVLLISTPAFAHKKKEKHVVCLINEVYDPETNTCKPIDSNDSVINIVDTDTEVDNNTDTHEHGRGHLIGRGHFEHGNGKGLGHYK